MPTGFNRTKTLLSNFPLHQSITMHDLVQFCCLSRESSCSTHVSLATPKLSKDTQCSAIIDEPFSTLGIYLIYSQVLYQVLFGQQESSIMLSIHLTHLWELKDDRIGSHQRCFDGACRWNHWNGGSRYSVNMYWSQRPPLQDTVYLIAIHEVLSRLLSGEPRTRPQ